MPLVGVVPVLQSRLLSVACVLSKPQRRHLENYLQGLICQEHRRTLAAMSRHVPAGPASFNWERFVTASPWELPALNRAWPLGLSPSGKSGDPGASSRTLATCGRDLTFR
jgi:DDE superfamily endonuclease